MRYMGSKAKYAKHIMPILMGGHDSEKPYVEPFVGGGNMMSACPAPIRWGNDMAAYAVSLLDALSCGWVPPESLSEAEYKSIKANPDSYAPEFVGFAAYSCSYAGKFWGGYARGDDAKGNPRNFASEQKRHLLKQANGLVGVVWSVGGYTDMAIPDGATVYCDPPYAGTTGYKGGFDHAEFWGWCQSIADRGCRVFVSEYTAPHGWAVVWEKEVTNSLTRDTGAKRGVERLFTIPL